MDEMKEFIMSCPTPTAVYEKIVMAHGGGGSLMRRLIDDLIRPAFSNSMLDAQTDSATFSVNDARLAFTTDSYVVSPLFFPGGDIGTLAVNGTVNDLAMSGARPLVLSLAFIIEEGLPMSVLAKVTESIHQSAEEACVQIVTGDTKVVDHGRGDGLFATTAGVGVIEHDLVIAPASVAEGDVILLNGDIGRHGMAVMAARQDLVFENVLESDCAPLSGLVQTMIDGGVEIHCLRDLTRGGLASGMVEIASTAGLSIQLQEKAIPVREDVRSACEILGFDPLYVANEGRMVAFLPERDAERALEIMRSHPEGKEAAIIGRVTTPGGQVTMKTIIGASRVVDMLSGEQLPRIC